MPNLSDDEGASSTAPRLRRRVAVVLRHSLLVVAAALLAVTGVLFGSELTSPGPPPLGPNAHVTSAVAFQPSTACDRSTEQDAKVFAVVNRFDPLALTLTMTAWICTPPPFLEHLYAPTRSEHQLAPLEPREEEPSPLVLPRRYDSWRINLPYRVGTHRSEAALPSEQTRQTTTLGQLYITKGGFISPAVSLGQIVVPLAAAVRRYPLDWYSGDLELGVLMSTFHALLFCRSADRESCTSALPYDVSIVAGPGLSSLVVRASVEHGSVYNEGATAGNGFVSLRLERSGSTHWYVTVIALIPLILGILLSVVLLADKPERPRPEALAGIAAVLLAVLPIRLVLVPAEESELTLVDYGLGFEMAALAALACVYVWRTLGGSTKSTSD